MKTLKFTFWQDGDYYLAAEQQVIAQQVDHPMDKQAAATGWASHVAFFT
jgi:hypothetical protein